MHSSHSSTPSEVATLPRNGLPAHCDLMDRHVSPPTDHVLPPSWVTYASPCPYANPSWWLRKRTVRGASPSVRSKPGPTCTGLDRDTAPSCVAATKYWQVVADA